MIGVVFCLELGDPISSILSMLFSGHSFGVVRILFALFLSSEIVVVDAFWMRPWDVKII